MIVEGLLLIFEVGEPGTVPAYLATFRQPLTRGGRKGWDSRGQSPRFWPLFRQPLTRRGRKGWIDDCRVMIVDF